MPRWISLLRMTGRRLFYIPKWMPQQNGTAGRILVLPVPNRPAERSSQTVYIRTDDQLISLFSGNFGSGPLRIRGQKSTALSFNLAAPQAATKGRAAGFESERDQNKIALIQMPKMANEYDDSAVKDSSVFNINTKPPVQEGAAVQIRKNFNETAFFFPDLRTAIQGR